MRTCAVLVLGGWGVGGRSEGDCIDWISTRKTILNRDSHPRDFSHTSHQSSRVGHTLQFYLQEGIEMDDPTLSIIICGVEYVVFYQTIASSELACTLVVICNSDLGSRAG